MNVMCIFPGMNEKANDNAFLFTYLYKKGVQLSVITSRSMGQKGSGSLPIYENMAGISIYRLYTSPREMFLFPNKAISKVIEVARYLKPDVIFCSQELNMRLAILVQKVVKKPIVLLVEDAGRIFSGEFYSSFKMKSIMSFFGMPLGTDFWSWLCNKSNAIITCHPRDQLIRDSLSRLGKPVFYLPWPSYIPDNFQSAPRNEFRGIYVGSLFPFKNTQEFEITLPIILDKTKTAEFVVIGPGPHANIVKKLKQRYGDAIRYLPYIPRVEALKLISSSFYAYTPVRIGGWGFIGDCWSMKTPIIMTHNDRYVTNNENALVSQDENSVAEKINTLYHNDVIYKNLQINGYEEYRQRKADVVAEKLYKILKQVV